jgi:hypothetical protein
MRTTITLDDDAATIARERAREAGITLSKAVSSLIREGATSQRKPVQYPGKFRPFPERPDEPLITLELVNTLRDELP